jgi:hypothetical protein
MPGGLRICASKKINLKNNCKNDSNSKNSFNLVSGFELIEKLMIITDLLFLHDLISPVYFIYNESIYAPGVF